MTLKCSAGHVTDTSKSSLSGPDPMFKQPGDRCGQLISYDVLMGSKYCQRILKEPRTQTVGVIRFAYRRDRIKSYPYDRIRVKTLKRKITDCSLILKQSGPPKFESQDQHAWAENLIWSLYSGEIRVYNRSFVAKGWSFNDRLPLYWGLDIIDWRPEYYSAWGWLEIPDWGDRLFGPEHQFAAKKIRRLLGEKALLDYLGGIHES